MFYSLLSPSLIHSLLPAFLYPFFPPPLSLSLQVQSDVSVTCNTDHVNPRDYQIPSIGGTGGEPENQGGNDASTGGGNRRRRRM